jgi:hypothetical protein
MGRITNKILGTPDARAEHREALSDQNTRFNNSSTSPDDPGYLAANQRTAAAEKKLPRWRRRG